MIQYAAPLLAVLACLAVGAVALVGPAPVVVVGEPTARGWVTLVVTAPAGHEVREGWVRVIGPDGESGLELGPGHHRVQLGHGPHRLEWTVAATGGGTTSGSVDCLSDQVSDRLSERLSDYLSA